MFVVAVVKKESADLGALVGAHIVDRLSATLLVVTGPSDVRAPTRVSVAHPKKERGIYIMLLFVVRVVVLMEYYNIN